MFDTIADAAAGATTASDVLARAVVERGAADAAEARLLVTACDWADLHPPESLHDAATFGPTIPGSEHEERIAGIGCPLVAEFCLPELAAALGMSTHAGKRLVGHALELRHRLPQLWARVQAGQVQAWRARRVAEATIHADLTVAGAGFVDQMVTPFASSITTAQLDRVVAEALQRFTPSDTDPDADPNGLEHDPRYVRIDDPLTPYGGTALLRGELDPADARDLETALAARAQQLAEDGCTLPLPVRRAMALADLARQQTALDLSNVEDAPARSRPARQLVLHVHLAAAVTGDSDGTVTFDRLATLEAGQQQVLLDQVGLGAPPPTPLCRSARFSTSPPRSAPAATRPRSTCASSWSSATAPVSSRGAPAPPAPASSTTSPPTTPPTRTPPAATSRRSAPSTTASRPTAAGDTRPPPPASTPGPHPTATPTPATTRAPRRGHRHAQGRPGALRG